MRLFASWWERIRARHAAPAVLVALGFAAALPHLTTFGKLLSGSAGFIWG